MILAVKDIGSFDPEATTRLNDLICKAGSCPNIEGSAAAVALIFGRLFAIVVSYPACRRHSEYFL